MQGHLYPRHWGSHLKHSSYSGLSGGWGRLHHFLKSVLILPHTSLTTSPWDVVFPCKSVVLYIILIQFLLSKSVRVSGFWSPKGRSDPAPHFLLPFLLFLSSCSIFMSVICSERPVFMVTCGSLWILGLSWVQIYLVLFKRYLKQCEGTWSEWHCPKRGQEAQNVSAT